jgi:hypothetical protein
MNYILNGCCYKFLLASRLSVGVSPTETAISIFLFIKLKNAFKQFTFIHIFILFKISVGETPTDRKEDSILILNFAFCPIKKQLFLGMR